MSSVRVCVDVVGGDEKPQVVLDGIEAALAANPDIEVLAAGPAEIVNPFAASHARVEALEAPDVIAMDDDPIRAVMTKRKSSIVLSCRAIKKGNADAFFSAGSTGAMTAAATAYVTPFRYQAEGKKQPVRPCLTNALPNRAGGLTVLCDMGANPDVEVDDMVRFAQMGSAYARVVLGIEHPRVGLLANGTEDEKGSNFTKACFPAMKAAVPGFVGNCEGTDITSGNFDVVVADGMSGNIALKATEGAAKFLLQELKGAFMSSLGTKIAALLIKKQMREIKAKLSGDAKGGAILLGLRGVVLIGHGATSVEAVKNGTLAAAEAAVVTSGTATLETALLNVPEVVVYRTLWFQVKLQPYVLKVPYVSLVNLNLGRESVVEIIQSDLDITRAERELRAILTGGEKRERMLRDFAELQAVIGAPGASDRFAARMVELLKKQVR